MAASNSDVETYMDLRTKASARARRDAIRFPVTFDASLIWRNDTSAVLVQDISSGGMLIAAQGLPPENCPVRLLANGLEVSGHIVWRTENLAGIGFDSPVDPLAVIRNNSPRYRMARPSID